VEDYSYKQTIGVKPEGLWFSVNNGWEEWAGQEMHDLTQVPYYYKVNLGKTKLCSIRTEKELDAFKKTYGVSFIAALEKEVGHELPPNLVSAMKGTDEQFKQVDWARVAVDYDGIIFPKYQRRFRQRAPVWYDMIDCSSGCIWRPKGVTLSVLREPIKTELEI